MVEISNFEKLLLPLQIIFSNMWWRSVIYSGILFGIILALIPHLVWIVSFVIGRIAHFRVPYGPFGWTALGLVGVLWSMLAYGFFVGLWQIEVKTVKYESRDVPNAFGGYRIVHISDLHVDTYNNNPDALARVVDSVNAQHPDLILFTGDMVTGSMQSVFLHEETLKKLQAKDGVMSVLGNHDFFIYDRNLPSRNEKLAAADALAKFESEKLGWQVLRNAHVVLHRGEDSLCVAGVDNINGGKGFATIQMGDLKKALNGTEGVPFRILLSHDPSHWRAEVLPKTSVQITLSGHTHAAQLRFFGWTPASLVFDENDGRYDEQGRMLYVNAGIGCTAPVRIGCPSEITVIRLSNSIK